jgi:hypothetical protein
MGVLWFARQGIDSTSGFPAYDLPVDIIAANLGGERNFQFLSPLHSPPITSLGRSEQAVDYRLVLMELDETELTPRTGGLTSIKSRLIQPKL